MTKIYDILHLPTGTKFSDQCISITKDEYTAYPFKTKQDCEKAFYIIDYICKTFPSVRDDRNSFLPYYLKDTFNIGTGADKDDSQYSDLLYGWWCWTEEIFARDEYLPDFFSYAISVKSKYLRDEYEIVQHEVTIPIEYGSYKNEQLDDIAVGFINT